MARWFWSAVIIVMLAGFAWVVAETPAVVSAGIAVAVACIFSAWLDRTAEARPSSLNRGSSTRAGLLLPAALIAASGSAFAQEAPGTDQQSTTSSSNTSSENPLAHIQLGVTLEGYYQYNWNRPYDRVNLLRAYDTRANVFSLQQAALVIESAPKLDEGRRFGARVDLQFGQATETVQGSPANEPRPDVYRNVWQAYGTYVFPVGRGLQADFGKFASSLGYETNYAKDNNHFSRAYLFNFLPFYHSGLRLTLPVDDKVTLMYTLTNGIQQTEDFNDFKSQHVSAVLKPAKAVSWTVNYYVGQEQPDGSQGKGPDGAFRVFDTYAAYSPTSKLSLAADVNYVTNEVNKADAALSLQGTAAYARYQVSTPAGLALRYERLNDEGLFGGIEQVLQGITATTEYKFAEGFLVRGEFRRDWSDARFFTGPEPGSLRTHQNTLLAGLVWWFGNKSGAW
jgi:hypothetical protein